MLTTLRIKNLALVADLTLELPAGCIAITGETGAGKSILIGALNLVLGERADRTMIRSGSDSCSVEAVFDVAQLRAPLQPFLEANGLEPCEENQLLLKRAHDALPKGGRVIIFNMMANDDDSGPLATALGSPYFLSVATGEGMLYSWSDYEACLAQAGFTQTERFELPRSHGVLVGTKS